MSLTGSLFFYKEKKETNVVKNNVEVRDKESQTLPDNKIKTKKEVKKEERKDTIEKSDAMKREGHDLNNINAETRIKMSY